MRLTDRILQVYLQDYFDIPFTGNVGLQKELNGVLLWEGCEQAEPGWIYIVNSSDDLPVGEYPDRVMFLCCKRGEHAFSQNRSFLIPESFIGASNLINAVMRCFHMYESWEAQLLEIRERNGAIDDILNASLPIFRNPLFLFRSDLSTMASAGNVSMATEDIKKAGNADMDRINELVQDKDFAASRRATEFYWGPEHILGIRSLCFNIQRGGELTHCLVVAENQEKLTEAAGDLLQILGAHIRHCLYRVEGNGFYKNESLHAVLNSILTDRTLDYMEASQKLAQHGWTKEDEYLCLVFQLTYLDQSTLPITSICNYVGELFKDSVTFSHKELIVTFFNMTKIGQSKDELASQLSPFIRDSYLKAGYSRVMQGHMNLRRQYVQSTLALDVGSRKKPYLWIHHFDSIAMTYIIEQVTRRLPGSMLCHSGLLKLKAMDEANGSEYVKTLKSYLDNHQNVVHAAGELFIHRSTLLYRLEKIKDVLESDLDDPEELLYLNLSFVLLEREEY